MIIDCGSASKQESSSITLLTPPATAAQSTRREVEFETSKEGKIGVETVQIPWEWPRIRQLLDEVSLLTTKRNTTALNTDYESLKRILYPHLPNGKGELRTLIGNAKRYFQMAHRSGTLEAKQALKPYRRRLRALVWATRQKLAVMLCMPNQSNWDPRAYQLFLEFQSNLGQMSRLHFVTVTFTGNPSYQLIKERLRRLKRKLHDEGFHAVPVVSLHPSVQFKGRMHVHLVVWSRRTRSASEERTAVSKCRTFLKSPKSPFGFTKWSPVASRESFLKVFAYMAWNYSQTIKLPKDAQNPIPKRARVLNRPKEVVCGTSWARVEKRSPVTPATVTWNKAVLRYAAANGRSLAGDRRWIWRERRHIREFLEQENWWVPTVTGLDGFTYQVTAAGVDHCQNEIYLVSSEDRGGFYLTEAGLKELARLQAAPGTFMKKPLLNLITGKTAYWFEVHGMYAFM
ncbi:MAG: hypothetical protein EAZ82_12205 [Verrucomicrobia bacterium]|nr:MAG: hypothetical protein EAZ82_12205 [Verrucomicrobiota bacterium]